jgi:transcriptional regulator with XRE-family HTH domain
MAMELADLPREYLRSLPPLTRIRHERLQARVPLAALALASGIGAATLSCAERGLQSLTPEQETARVAALSRLSRV